MNWNDIYHRITGNHDARVLLHNFAALGFLQVIGYVFPFITLPYLTRVIGIERFGEIAFAAVVSYYFQMIVDYGFSFSAVRDIARCRSDKMKISDIYSRVVSAKVLLVAVSFFLLCVLIYVIPKFHDMRLVLLLSFLSVPGYAMSQEWLFQGVEKMKYITISSFFAKVVGIVAIFLFIKEEKDYILYPVFTALEFMVADAISIYVICKIGIKFQRVKVVDVLNTIKDNTNLFINQIAPSLYNSFSILLIGFFHHSAANGIFDAGNRFNNAACRLINVISRTFFPFLSRRMDKHSSFVRLNVVASLTMGGTLFLFAPAIIRLFFTTEFMPAVNVLRIMSVSLVFLAISNAYATNYLILKGFEKEVRQITVVASVVGFVISIPLVYFYSYIGGALTIAIVRGIIALLSAVKARREMRVNNKKKSL